MKILHIDTENTWRGGENQVRLLIEGLNSFGTVRSYLVANPDSLILERLHKIAVPFPVKIRGGLDLIAAGKIVRFCESVGVNIIDAHTSHGHMLGLLVKRKLPELKLVVHRRVDYIPSRNYFNRLKYKSKKIDKFIAISSAIKDILINYGVKQEKISVAKSAYSDQVFPFSTKQEAKESLAKEFNFDPSVTLLGNASALTDQKDYPTLIKSLAVLKKKNVPFFCIIAGDGGLKSSLDKLINELSLNDCVKLIGFRNDVPRLLQAFDILTLTSKFEGLGTIMLDAINAGCCVVASKVGGIPEVVKHQETGLLSPVGGTESFAKNFEIVIKDKNLRTTLNESAKNLISKEFSAQKMVEGNLAVYNSL
jgi:L-malate glycosyltransferase